MSSVLRSARVALRKRLGQHLLVRGDTLAAIVAAARIGAHETVLEIGPGTGNLTALLLPRARAVFAVELDGRLAAAAVARARAAGFGDRFFCAQGCALRLPLPAYDVLVANIPYQISSPVLARLWAARPPPRAAVLLLQREFAERLVALPGGAAYSRLSVNCALLSDSARIVMRVGREQFVPPPRVDSAVIEIVPRPGGAPPGLDFARWDAFLRIAFGGKNKRLRSVLVNKHVLAMLLANKEAGSGGGGADSAAAAAAAMAAPAASEDASSSDDDDDDDSRTVGLAGEDEDEHGEGGAQGAEDWLTTQHGRFPRAALHGVRDSIDAILGRLGALEWRANGMPVDAFRAVFSGLEEAGWRFTPVRLRVFPAAPGADGAAPPADAVR